MSYIKWNQVPNVLAFTTTKNGGHSLKPFESFNQAYQVGDNYDHVRLNRQKLCLDNGIDEDSLVLVHQSHSDIIVKVDETYKGKGKLSFESGVEADALYTTDKGIALGVFHADCCPIFISSKSGHLVGIVHAGEKGTFKKVLFKSLSTIINNENINPEDLLVHIGPSLTFSHRIVNLSAKEMVEKYGDEYLVAFKITSGVSFIDLPLINYLQAREANIPSKNISVYDGCTYENEDLFFSHSRENKTGRHLSIIKKI